MVEQARIHTNDSLTKITIPYLNRENDNAMAVDRGKRTGWKTINKIYEKKKKLMEVIAKKWVKWEETRALSNIKCFRCGAVFSRPNFHTFAFHFLASTSRTENNLWDLL